MLETLKVCLLVSRFSEHGVFNVALRFDEDVGKVELDYPRDMSMWSGVGYNIDTVFQWKDGEYYQIAPITPKILHKELCNVYCLPG